MLATQAELEPQLKKALDRETRVGMTESILSHVPATSFLATRKPAVALKTLYSDFVVRELAPLYNGGEPLVLEPLPDTLTTPAPKKEGADNRKRPREETKEGEASSPSAETEAQKTLVQEAFSPLLTAEDVAALVAAVDNGEEKVVLSTKVEKAQRGAIHETVKRVFGKTHVSSTDNGCIVVSKATAADRREQDRRSRPIRTRTFLHFTLYKENLDTNQVFRTMARHLHMSTRQFQFCGTKDKRAVTLQRVAIRDMDPKRVAVLNQRSFGPQGTVRVCGFKEETNGLKLGDSHGNHFRIVLRQHAGMPAQLSEDELRAMETALMTVGAVNYFGLQRFGTTDILTSDVGVLLLRGDYKGAITLMFESRACIVPDMREALPAVASQDYAAAQEKVPYFCFQERDMLKYLVKSPGDYLGALQTIPRTLCMLYFHAVQSLIWNRMVSRRLATRADEASLSPLVGDLVFAAVYEKRMEVRDAAYTIPVWSFIKDGEDESDRSHALPAVRVLSAEDDLSLFALSDIVLPVPGPDAELRFPEVPGCSKEDYMREAAELGVAEALLNSEGSNARNDNLVKIFHYHGAYRPLCVRPLRVRLTSSTAPSWRAAAVPTDLEQLEPKVIPAPVGDNSGQPAGEPKSEDSPVNVLVAEFSMPPGSYATCVLREFCTAVSEDYHRVTSPTEDEGDDKPESAAQE